MDPFVSDFRKYPSLSPAYVLDWFVVLLPNVGTNGPLLVMLFDYIDERLNFVIQPLIHSLIEPSPIL
jgi:hypothetical protein